MLAEDFPANIFLKFCDNGFFRSELLLGESGRLRGLTAWTTAPDCGKGTCHRIQSTVGSATTETRTLRELGIHAFILRTLLYFFYVQLFDVNRKSSRCKSYYNEQSILLACT